MQPRIHVPLGQGMEAAVVVTRLEIVSDDEGVFLGHVEGRPDSLAVLSYVGSAESATITLRDTQRSYVVRDAGDGVVRVTELDLSRAPVCGL